MPRFRPTIDPRTPRAARPQTLKRKPPAFSAGGFRSRFGPIGTGRGTCQKGPVRVVRAAGGADVCGFARTYVGCLNSLLRTMTPRRIIPGAGSKDNRTFVQFR